MASKLPRNLSTVPKWQIILKADISNEAQYERASRDDRRKWHGRQIRAYWLRLKNLQARVDTTDEESPQYKEMVELQELYRFHTRQRGRIAGRTKQDFYSLNLENNRQNSKGLHTPHGNPMPYQELSQEVYETLTTEQKGKYHMSMAKIPLPDSEITFHRRMYSRIRANISHPTFAASKYGGKSAFGKTYTKEEYENMSNEDKRKYHSKMFGRFRQEGNNDMRRFHQKMYDMLRNNSKLPTFYSPEDEQ